MFLPLTPKRIIPHTLQASQARVAFEARRPRAVSEVRRRFEALGDAVLSLTLHVLYIRRRCRAYIWSPSHVPAPLQARMISTRGDGHHVV